MNKRSPVTRRVLISGILGLMLLAGAASAQAGDSCRHSSYRVPTCVYKTVTIYVTKRVAYQKKIARYDHCGRVYFVWKTYYKTVRVPVTYRIKVCH